MSYDYVVIENAALNGARGVVAVESVPSHEARGWTCVGPTSMQRDPIRTDEEQDTFDSEEQARLDALLVPVPEAVTKVTAPVKPAAEPSAPATSADADADDAPQTN